MNKVVFTTMMASVMAFSLTASASLVDITNNFNVFVYEGFESKNIDTHGRIAAGGDVTLSGYLVGQDASNADYTLISGGKVNFSNGEIQHGGIFADGDIIVNGCGVHGNVVSNGNVSGNFWGTKISNAGIVNPVDFDGIQNELITTSNSFSGKTGGTVSVSSSKEVTFIGKKTSGVTFFKVDGSLLANASSLTIDIADDELAIVNVLGNNVNIGDYGLFYNHKNVLFNFFEATDIQLKKSFKGSILAPLANVIAKGDNGSNGEMDGTLLAKSFKGGMQFHLGPFNYEPPTSVPEPSIVSFLLTGLLGLVPVIRRKIRK